MSPKLNLLTLFAAGQLFLDPDADPDALSRRFCVEAFGEDHAALGELFEAFEVVPGWGYYPRRKWSREALRAAYREIVERLEAVDPARCRLPLFPEPAVYRDDLLWFARAFLEMAGDRADRERIRKEYWQRSLSIYDTIPMSVDERAAHAARQFSQVLAAG
jgi:hypothetical protein